MKSLRIGDLLKIYMVFVIHWPVNCFETQVKEKTWKLAIDIKIDIYDVIKLDIYVLDQLENK